MGQNAPARPPLDWSGKAPFPFTRESTIRLDAEGRFFHEGALVEHPGLARAMHTWISRHPDDGRWVLENGWDWCYLVVDDTPLTVRSAKIDGDAIEVTLSDGSIERIDPTMLRLADDGSLRCEVKAHARRGPYPARFDRHAMIALGEVLNERDGRTILTISGREVPIG